MPSGSKQQTTTQSNEPWSGAQGPLNTALTGAVAEYNKGLQPYTGSTVVQWSPHTNQAVDNLENITEQNGLGSAYGWTNQDILNSGGLSATQRNTMQNYQSIADQGGYNNDTLRASNALQGVIDSQGYTYPQLEALTGYRSTVSGGGFNNPQNEAMANVRNLANSQYAISPELQRVLDAQATKVSDAVNLNAAGAGRYGSGSNQTLLARNVGDLANSTIYNDYTNFLGRRDAANNNLFSMGQTGQGNVASALGNMSAIGQQSAGNMANAAAGLGNLGNTAINNRSNALGNVANLSQQGFNNLPAAYNNLKQPSLDLMNVGAMSEDLAQRQMNDQLRIFNEQQNLPRQNVEWLNAIASGAGSLGGTQRTSQPGTNPFLSGLGYASSGLGLLGMF